MAFLSGDPVCPTHGCKLTGFTTLFCPRCEEGEKGVAVGGEEFYFFFTSLHSRGKTELVLPKGQNIYPNLEKLEEDLDMSGFYLGTKGVPAPTYVIWKTPKEGLDRYLVSSVNIFAKKCLGSDIVGVPAIPIKER